MVKVNFEVQIKLSMLSIIAGQTHVETNTLLVYMLRSHARIQQDLMLCVAPHVGHSGFKFVPANVSYNKWQTTFCQSAERTEPIPSQL
eukprot:7034862-Ditylum_brightwellii.AAC.1